MATYYSNEYDKSCVTKPLQKLSPAELNGKVRRLTGNITLGAEILAADTVKMALLPANSVIIAVRMIAPGGASGTIQLGWGAGENEVADANGIFSAVPANAAVDVEFDLSSGTAAKNKRFSDPVDIELTSTVDTAGWSGDLVEMEILYIIE